MNTNHILNVLLTLLYQQTTASRPMSWKETNERVMFNDNYIDNYSLKPTSEKYPNEKYPNE